MSKLYKCYGCGEKFPEKELNKIPVGKSEKNICNDCLEKRVKYQNFSICVCNIFGLKSPGPKLNRQRKILLDRGFTDEYIIELLEFLNSIKPLRWKDNTDLVIIQYFTEENCEKMRKYKKRKDWKAEKMANDIANVEIVRHLVPYTPEQRTVGYDLSTVTEEDDE